MIRSLMLHPALIVARGFESMDTSDMRFLNAYRKHFEEARELHKMKVYRPEDFLLGAILNPEDAFHDVNEAYVAARDRIDSFPYMTMYEVRLHFYYGRIAMIYEALCAELYRDLDQYATQYYRSSSYFESSNQVMRHLEKTPIYAKIHALHQCGLGIKLIDTFEVILSGYRSANMGKQEMSKTR